MAVSKLFAEKNGLSVNSPLKIDNKSYVVSGIYIAPDEVVAFDQTKSPDMSPDTNARILMLEDDFKAVNRDESIYFVGRFISEDDTFIYNKVLALAQEETILYATMSSEYSEVAELSGFVTLNTQLMIFVLSAVCVILTVALLIQITNQFTRHRKSIGVWMTTGFSRKQVVIPYSIYFFVFVAAAFSGMMLGFLMSYSLVEGASNGFNADLAQPSVDWLKWLLFLGATAVPPTLLTMFLAHRETKKMLRSLICGPNANQRINAFIRRISIVTSFMKFENRAKASTVVHKGVRLMSMLLTFFISYNLLGAGLAINSSVDSTLSDYKEFLKFDRIEYYDSAMIDNSVSAHNLNTDVFIDENVKLIKNTTKNIDIGVPMKLQGLSQDQQSIGVNSSLLTNGVIISQMAASKYGIAVNDELQFLIHDNHYTYKVAGINAAGFDSKIYIDIDEMYYWDKYTTGDYTGTYVSSMSKGQDVYDSIRSEELIKFYEAYGQSTGTVSGAMLIVAFVISMVLIILTAVFNYKDGMTKVALGKSLGDSNRKVNNMFVNVFDPVGAVGCFLGMLSLPFLLYQLEKVMISESELSSDYYIFFRASWQDMVIALIALMFFYGICKFSINLATRTRPIVRALQPRN
ncbi:MAG: ABC transporter permease [Peptococcaceae bacterium]|nr:ABC transporter permease [Peptococcaceae bacterium]